MEVEKAHLLGWCAFFVSRFIKPSNRWVTDKCGAASVIRSSNGLAATLRGAYVY